MPKTEKGKQKTRETPYSRPQVEKQKHGFSASLFAASPIQQTSSGTSTNPQKLFDSFYRTDGSFSESIDELTKAVKRKRAESATPDSKEEFDSNNDNPLPLRASQSAPPAAVNTARNDRISSSSSTPTTPKIPPHLTIKPIGKNSLNKGGDGEEQELIEIFSFRLKI